MLPPLAAQPTKQRGVGPHPLGQNSTLTMPAREGLPLSRGLPAPPMKTAQTSGYLTAALQLGVTLSWGCVGLMRRGEGGGWLLI